MRHRIEILLARGREFSGRALTLRAAMTLGIAISGLIASRSVVYAQTGAAFEVSPAIAHNGASASRTPRKIAFRRSRLGFR